MNKFLLEKSATEFRTKNGIGSRDPIRLKSILSVLNVITVFKPLSSNFSGMALKVEAANSINRFVLVNSRHSKGKQHFTICHELYHLFIQKDFTSMICDTGLFKRNTGEEYNADVFASILLLPEEGVKSLIPDNELGQDKLNLKTLLKIEHYFSCSRTALLYRLKELKLLSGKGYESFNTRVKSSAVKYGYSTDLYESCNDNLVIGDYGELAKELFDKEKISETHYISLLMDLGMNSRELDNIFNGEEDR